MSKCLLKALLNKTKLKHCYTYYSQIYNKKIAKLRYKTQDRLLLISCGQPYGTRLTPNYSNYSKYGIRDV